MKIDKRELLSIFLILFLLCCFLCTSCNTSKKATRSEEQTETYNVKRETAKDSSIIDYFVDTTKLSEMEVELTKTEYYPFYLQDSVQPNRKVQPIKQVTKARIQRKQKAGGTTAVKSADVSVRQDSTSTGTKEQSVQTTENEKKKAFPFWWLIFLIVGAMIFVYIKCK